MPRAPQQWIRPGSDSEFSLLPFCLWEFCRGNDRSRTDLTCTSADVVYHIRADQQNNVRMHMNVTTCAHTRMHEPDTCAGYRKITREKLPLVLDGRCVLNGERKDWKGLRQARIDAPSSHVPWEKHTQNSAPPQRSMPKAATPEQTDKRAQRWTWASEDNPYLKPSLDIVMSLRPRWASEDNPRLCY